MAQRAGSNTQVILKTLRDQADAARVGLYREAGVSGRRDDRPELARLLSELDSFDRLIVPAIDRLGRGSRHLLTVYDALENSSVGLVSLRESFDTSTPAGRFVRLIL